MLKMSGFGVSWGHLVAKARKLENELFGSLLAPFRGQGAKNLKMKCLGTTWSHLVTKAQNYQNELFRSLPGVLSRRHVKAKLKARMGPGSYKLEESECESTLPKIS